jgi:hypothetical protein
MNRNWLIFRSRGFSRSRSRRGLGLRNIRYRRSRTPLARSMIPLSSAYAVFGSGFTRGSIGQSCKRARIQRLSMNPSESAYCTIPNVGRTMKAPERDYLQTMISHSIGQRSNHVSTDPLRQFATTIGKTT